MATDGYRRPVFIDLSQPSLAVFLQIAVICLDGELLLFAPVSFFF
jgi:hypothetical protein